ncbi:MAG: hypothetical protein HON51_04415 [Gammaproteobacteria bacterium]|jgi:hypothetical protein|nr:hypothetical protein [Gammaproteobacteria bacterium]MBT5826509.1 hypothetical protein [Gammaproteobacteria bacterium]MBT5967375.1 hypothetical protein [Gammaproteobacteria bacterium]MBT6419953.1 hypothetical protein [Gammaproteobacteria bacterium]MBT6575472.1 hypothetical protein [Gammaproteobacteria bacterium]
MKKQVSIPGLAEQAQALHKSGKYKEAIKLYEKLLQTPDADLCREPLANCYVQRAIGFAAKDMYKEALALWENHPQFTQPPYEAYDQYITWVVLSNNPVNIQTSLASLSAQQLDKQYPALATVLGFLMLTRHPEFEQLLAQDSVLIAHFKIVKTAVLALQNNNTEKFNQTLKQLPYRSAFRDFRILCNGIVAMSDEPNQAQELLTKIPSVSPYTQTAQILLACTKQGAELANELLQLSHQQRHLVAEIKGLNNRQLDFIAHYSRQYDQLSDKVQFNLAVQYQDLLGTEIAQSVCQILLANYPAGNTHFIKHFGEPSEFEDNRVKALRCELSNNVYDADYYWRQCLNILAADKADNNLPAALILRHMATREPEGLARTKLLEESLDYAPEDRHSYFQVIQYYSQQAASAKEYTHWLDRALEQFPQDVEVLTQTVKAATNKKTYKKASQYATKILKIDPLNTFAKQTLFSSYLAHVRRLMRENNYRLVEQEINRAEKLTLGKTYDQQTQLMRALLCFANTDKQQGLQEIINALASVHTDPVNSHFQAIMESLLNGLSVATILRELPAVKEYLLTAHELTRLMLQLKLYANDSDNWEYLYKALDDIKAPLKKSLSDQDYPEDLLLNLCQVLDSFVYFELLRHCARVAQLKWKKPVWIYYQVYADNNGEAADCDFWEVQRLENASKQAGEDKDYPTAMLIDKFLGRYFEVHPERIFEVLKGLLGGMTEARDDIGGDPLEELFGHLSDRVMIDLNSKAESLLKKLTPEKLTQELAQPVAEEKSLFLAMMENPEIFSALILLRAADELLIDIDTDIYDVIDVFGISANNNSTSFPF